MNKKNIFIYFLLALPMMLMTSCLKDQEDMFDKSASARVTEYLENARKVLSSAENGWVLNYYPDRNQSYGGFPYVLKFDDDNVEARYIYGYGEDGADGQYTNTPITTTYVLNNEDGPVLIFDTYNEYTHLFATPSGSSGAGGYEAYDGDFMFIIMDISDDENVITLKGSRSGNVMYMYRNTVSADEYLNKARTIAESIELSTYKKGDLTIVLDTDNQQASITAGEETADAAYIVTDKGIKLYEPVTVGGYKLDEFTYDIQACTMTSTADASLVMEGSLPDGWKSYEELAGTYKCGEELTINVSCNDDGKTYSITGMSYVGGVVQAQYKYSTGSFVITTPQYMGTFRGMYSWLIATDGSYISWGENTLTGTNSTEGPLIVTFSGAEYSSVMEYVFSTEQPSSGSGQGYLTMYPNPLTFEKAE